MKNQINLPYGRQNYKRLILLTWGKDANTGRWKRVNNLIKTVRVRKRANTIHYAEREQIEIEQRLKYNGTVPSGTFVIDFEEYGKHARALNTSDTTEFVLEIETNSLEGYTEFKTDILLDVLELPIT